jgi:hypothetical protein
MSSGGSVLPGHTRYVIVVHGMGEARKNETFINVINRFAEARRHTFQAENDGVLTLGRSFEANAYPPDNWACKYPLPLPSGPSYPWVEFKGAPGQETVLEAPVEANP